LVFGVGSLNFFREMIRLRGSSKTKAKDPKTDK
jgi:hypothetical protein